MYSHHEYGFRSHNGFEPDVPCQFSEVEPEDSYLISLRSRLDSLSERDRSRFSISLDNLTFDDAMLGGGNDY